MEKLREMVLNKISSLTSINTKEELEELKKLKLIEEILKDDACFFKISSDIAYSILIELGIDNPFEYYKKLISYKEFEKNRKNFEL